MYEYEKAADDFVITVKTDNAGSSTGTQFTIPTYSGGTYDYNVDCNNDGVNEASAQAGDYTCSYAAAGTYTVRIKDNTGLGTGFPAHLLPLWRRHAETAHHRAVGQGPLDFDELRLCWLRQPGGAGDRQPRPLRGDGHELYVRWRPRLQPGHRGWNTANVTNMSYMFYDASAFNQDIGGWNTANVTNMSSMFDQAVAFNQDIGGWNTANVTNMIGMFWGAVAFNRTSAAGTPQRDQYQYMFYNAVAFNQNIGSWDTGKVLYMGGMFEGASAFNQNIGGWNTANVAGMVGSSTTPASSTRISAVGTPPT